MLQTIKNLENNETFFLPEKKTDEYYLGGKENIIDPVEILINNFEAK